jgi:hypothetical protein
MEQEKSDVEEKSCEILKTWTLVKEPEDETVEPKTAS